MNFAQVAITTLGEDEFVRDNFVVNNGEDTWLGAYNGETYFDGRYI